MKRLVNRLGVGQIFELFSVFLLTFALRVYRIRDYLTFLGDEGRDVRIVRDLVVEGNLIFIGPQTSVGNMYLGPWYYYMMAPFLWLFRLDPVGPAVMVALLAAVTSVLIYLIGKRWFGVKAGLVASLLFALSPVAIIYGRSSWNPNPMPFFALLAIYSGWEVYVKRNYKYIQVGMVSLTLALNMHYLGLLLLPTLGTLWALTLWRIIKDKTSTKEFLRNTLLSLLWFFLLMSPLVLFDIKHSGQNFSSFSAFFSDRQTTVNVNPLNSDRFGVVLEKITSDVIIGMKSEYSMLTAGVLVLMTFIAIFIDFKKNKNLLPVVMSVGFGYFGLSLYKQHVYAHYLAFLIPSIYLLIGFVFQRFDKKITSRIVGYSLLGLILFSFISNSPLKQAPNRQLERTEEVVDLIIKESKGNEFNFALIAKTNYDESYRYFLENKKAKMIRGEDEITNQLFVVCEDGDTCKPEGNPQYQVAIFGPSNIKQEWRVDHIRVFRMEHSF